MIVPFGQYDAARISILTDFSQFRDGSGSTLFRFFNELSGGGVWNPIR